MEEALYDTSMCRKFGELDMGEENLPDESTILRFSPLLEANNLSLQILATLTAEGLRHKRGTAVDATLITAPCLTKNSRHDRDPAMHQTKNGNQWHFGIKAHIGVDADSALVHTVIGTAENVNDVNQAAQLVHSEEADVFADAGSQGVAKREETQDIEVDWHVAMRPSKRRALDKSTPMGIILDQLEQTKNRIRAKVEHVFRVDKRQFGYGKMKYRGLAMDTDKLMTTFARSNLWMMHKRVLNMAAQGCVRPKQVKG